MNVVFKPTAPGPRVGAVVLYGNGSPASIAATTYVSGLGSGPVLTYTAPTGVTQANALVAGLSYPIGSAIDAGGNLYITDDGSGASGFLLKVPFASGALNSASQTVLASVEPTDGHILNPTAPAVDGAGNVYFANFGTFNIIKIAPNGSGSLVGASSGLFPLAVAVDTSGNLFFAGFGFGNTDIYEIAAGGSTAQLIASVPSANSTTQVWLAFDPAGSLYLSSSPDGTITKIPYQSGALNGAAFSTIASGLPSPSGMFFDAAGNLYLTLPGGLAMAPNQAGPLNFTATASVGNFVFPVDVASDGKGRFYVVDLSSAGGPSIQFLDFSHASVAFPSTQAGASSAAQTLAVGNIGNAALQYTGAPTQTDAADFTIAAASANSCDVTGATPLAAGASCNLALSFTPSATGPLTDQFTVASNAVNTAPLATLNPATLTMTGSATAVATTATLAQTAPALGSTIVANQNVTVTATVAGSFGSLTPAGTVTFSVDGAAGVAGSALVGNASSYTTSFATPGNHSIVATFVPTGTAISGSPSSSLAIVVSSTATNTTLALTAPAGGSVTYGQSAQVTATVSLQTGTGTPTGSVVFTVDGAVQPSIALNGSAQATITLPSLSAGLHSITAAYSATGIFANSATSSPLSFNVGKAALTVALATSGATQLLANPVTFTAQVASATSGLPTGSVSFFDGGALLGSVALAANGQASLTTTALGAGSHSITAAYSGDSNFTASSSSAQGETITDFSLNLASSNVTQSVAPGGSAVYTFTVTPIGGPLPIALALTVAGLPPGATYTLSPTTIPAGSSGASSVTLTIQTAALKGRSEPPTPPWTPLAPVALALLLLPLTMARRAREMVRRMPRMLALALVAALALGGVLGLSGCGSGGFFNQPSSTYSISVTAAGGALQRTAQVSLIVQ